MSNKQGFYYTAISSTGTTIVRIYKYLFNSQILTYQSIPSYDVWGHGWIMLSETQLFGLWFDTSLSNLYFNKFTFGSTSAEWTAKLTLSLNSTSLSETFVSNDKTKLYIFTTLISPQYLYFIQVSIADGGKVGTWYKSDTAINRVRDSAQYGNYIVASLNGVSSHFLMLFDLSLFTFSFKIFSGNSIYGVGVDSSSGR